MDSLDTVSFCIAHPEFELVEILLSHHMEGWFTGMNSILMNIYIIYYFLNLYFIYF